MTSPLSVISAGSFFTGLMREYSSLGWPGTTVVGTNSILSIRPSSIAAMRTLRANSEVWENVSFMQCPLKKARLSYFGSWPGLSRPSTSFLLRRREDVDARDKPAHDELCSCSRTSLRRDNFLPLFAKPLDAERDHVADIEEFRRLHAGTDAGRRARRDDVARQ